MKPDSCICPNDSYICRADLVTTIAIDNSALSDPFTCVVDISVRPPSHERGTESIIL